jgi:hypothetical protein
VLSYLALDTREKRGYSLSFTRESPAMTASTRIPRHCYTRKGSKGDLLEIYTDNAYRYFQRSPVRNISMGMMLKAMEHGDEGWGFINEWSGPGPYPHQRSSQFVIDMTYVWKTIVKPVLIYVLLACALVAGTGSLLYACLLCFPLLLVAGVSNLWYRLVVKFKKTP